MTSPEIRVAQAEWLRAVDRNGGSIPLAQVPVALDSGDRDFAIGDLVAAGLMELSQDGVLRRGPRGSRLGEDDVQRQLTTRQLGRTLEIRASVGSTNDVALELAVAGRSPGLLVAAELQTAGRGRRGRVFDSRPGLGLWTTTLLPAPARAETAPRLSLLAGIAVGQAIERCCGVRPGLKWPNDVLLHGRKICGVLVEARSVGSALHPVAGIGLNVHHRAEDFPEELRERAGSLESTCGGHPERSTVLAAVMNELESVLDEERAGRLRLSDRFAEWDALADQPVEVLDAGPRGTARGVDEQGCLRLETATGTQSVRSGEVSLRAR